MIYLNSDMYYLLFGSLYPLSLLPMPLLYLLSDFLRLILYKMLRYRVGVVEENLRLAFPEKSVEERQHVMDKYYLHLCDSIVETIKLISISRAELNRRVKCNWDMFESMTLQNRNGQGYMSHQFNWEWGTVVCNWNAPRRFHGLYLRISNPAMDRLMYYIRSRSGTGLTEIDDMQQQMSTIQSQETLWGFIADQNPAVVRRASWHTFLNRKTAFFKAPELLARRYNNLVYFGEIIRLRRGYYEIKLKLAFENPKDTKDGEITEAYVRHLEESIKRQPENWVWSHRRWKHVFSEQRPE